MSVNVGQRNIPKTPQVAQCYAVDSAVDLLCHTLRNCKNKVFLNDYKDTVTDKVTATATEIYLSSYKVNECYKSWKAFALEGNSYKLLRRMDRYYSDLWRCGS